MSSTQTLQSLNQLLATKGLSIEDIRSALSGKLLTAEDSQYESRRHGFYGGIDRHPAFIIQAANAQDVAYAIALARQTGLELAIRSGGHSTAAHSTSEGGILLDLSPMKGLEINLEESSAWAETGLTAGEYTSAVGKHGLATGFGDTGSVGIGGITLGGGIGFFVRKYGLTIDDVLAAEIVTADGEILCIDEQNHPDLFWAVRGGGGNFGVVTRFKFRLHRVDKVIGGILVLPASPEILLALLEKADAAPEELSMIINVMTAPPMPFLPTEHHGKLISFIMPVYTGDIEEGQKALAPFREIATPIVDMLRPMSYPEIYPPDEESYHPIAAFRTFFLDEFSEKDAKTVFDYLAKSDAMMAVAHFRLLGGAMARIPVEATAFAHRQRRILANLAALYGDIADSAKYEAWVKDFTAALQTGEAYAYVNFLGNEGEARVKEAYPAATWERLRAVKTKYDPENLFHKNQNIPPAN